MHVDMVQNSVAHGDQMAGVDYSGDADPSAFRHT